MLDKIKKNQDFDVQEDKISKLKQLFPTYFNNGKFDIERFNKEIKEQTPIEQDGYSLNWLGKSYAEIIAALETETLLVPDISHNSAEENKDSENLYLIGDNIEVLKHLVNGYHESIKTIYIDPPYNTGSDEFVYEDSFSFTPQKLAEMANLTEEEAEKIINFTSKKSNSHSAWLTFMYPRLFIARELLSDEGVIFISIDDNEQSQLKLLADEIFGEENFVTQIIIQSNKRGQTYNDISKTHEYVLVYTKNDAVYINEIKKEIGDFKYEDNIGEFSERELRNRNPKFGRFNRPNLFYPIYVNPNIIDKDGYMPVSLEKNEEYSIEVFPLNSQGEESCWRWGGKKCLANIDETGTLNSSLVGRIKTTGEYGIYEKYRKTTVKAKSIWFEDDLFTEDGDVWDENEVITEQGSVELGRLGMAGMFDYPKPVYLIKKLLQLGSDNDSTVLDFFSGSGTTAQAVLELNMLDQGTRNFICVQLPESLDEKLERASKNEKTLIQRRIDFLDSLNKPRNIAEFGMERIRRSVINIKEISDSAEKLPSDLGFKKFSISEIEETTLSKMEEFEDTLISSDTILNTISLDAILTTWMLQDGNKLSYLPKDLDLSGYPAYQIGETLYLLHESFNIEQHFISDQRNSVSNLLPGK